MEIISRQQAITDGLKKYFTGQKCVNGHISERYVQSGGCQECIEDRSRERLEFERWNRRQLDAQDEERLSQRILDEKGTVAWCEWKLAKIKSEQAAAAQRDAETGRFKQFVQDKGCRHRRRFEAPDGSVVCRMCGAEVESFGSGRKIKRAVAFLAPRK